MPRPGYYYYRNQRAGRALIFIVCLFISTLAIRAYNNFQIDVLAELIRQYRLNFLAVVCFFGSIFLYRKYADRRRLAPFETALSDQYISQEQRLDFIRTQQPFVSSPASSNRPAPFVDTQTVFIRMEPIAFEKLVGNLLRLEGYTVIEHGGLNADGGIDLILENGDGSRGGVQCKKYWEEDIGVNLIRELSGALNDAGYSNGIFVTVKGFTKPAREFAARNKIGLWDKEKLFTVIERHSDALDLETLLLLNAPRPYCKECNSNMTVRRARTGRNSGSLYWICKSRACRAIQPFGAEKIVN